MSAKRKTPKAPALPASHLELMKSLGFEALWWRNVSRRVRCSDGSERDEWLPGDLVNWSEQKFVRYSNAGEGPVVCSVDGYYPQVEHSHGGCHDGLASALAWFAWLERAKVGDYYGNRPDLGREARI